MYTRKFVRRTGGFRPPVKAGTAKEIAQKALRGVQLLKKNLNVERLTLETSDNIAALGVNTNRIVHLNAIGQGDSRSGRTGNQVLMRDLEYFLYLFGAAGTVGNTVRVIVFMDKQQVADTSPAWNDVTEALVTYALPTAVNVGRFTILADHLFAMHSTANPNVILHKKININKNCIFNGTAGTDIQKNGLYMGVLSDVTGVTGWQWNCRLSYNDN